MPDWFDIETIDADTYAISEYRHWEEAHSYLVCGTERAALIDTGLGVADIRAVVDRLTALPVTVLTTHVHWDHIGGHRYFDDIAVFEAERDWLAVRFPIPAEAVRKNLTCRPCAFPGGFDPDRYQVFPVTPQRILHDGDRIGLGGRTLTVVHTPGHSPGHCCFYETERRYLYSGDLIYLGCLDAFYPTTDPNLFARSVKKVKSLAVDRILPGHHSLEIPVDLIDRIDSAFSTLADAGRLVQGGGIFPFGDIQIHI